MYRIIFRNAYTVVCGEQEVFVLSVDLVSLMSILYSIDAPLATVPWEKQQESEIRFILVFSFSGIEYFPLHTPLALYATLCYFNFRVFGVGLVILAAKGPPDHSASEISLTFSSRSAAQTSTGHVALEIAIKKNLPRRRGFSHTTTNSQTSLHIYWPQLEGASNCFEVLEFLVSTSHTVLFDWWNSGGFRGWWSWSSARRNCRELTFPWRKLYRSGWDYFYRWACHTWSSEILPSFRLLFCVRSYYYTTTTTVATIRMGELLFLTTWRCSPMAFWAALRQL